MNLLKLSSVVALSATTLLGGATVLADSTDDLKGQVRDVKTDATIQFVPGDGETVVIPPVDENDPDKEVVIPPIPGPDGNYGPLTITYASAFNFGSHEISNVKTHYPLIAEEYELKNNPGVMRPYVSFVQVSDTTGKNEGWNLNVELSEFEADADNAVNKTIAGAQIEFHNSFLKYPGDESQRPTIEMDDVKAVLAPNASMNLINAEVGKGAGVTDIVWGNQDAIDAQNPADGDVLNHAVQLHIPAASAVDATTYSATLDWSLVAGPRDVQ